MEMIAETEKALIGSLLLSQAKLVQVEDIVRPEDFTTLPARKAYMIILSLWKSKKGVDAVTVMAEDASLAIFLAESSGIGAPLGVLNYARLIAREAKERRIKSDLSEILNSSSTSQERLDNMLSLYHREMSVETKAPDVKSVLSRFGEKVQENKRKGSVGIPTGFSFLEELHVHYCPGHIWTMGGFTSVGKTAMMVQKICNLLMSNIDMCVVIISTEMTEEQIIARLLANLTGAHSYRVLSGNFWHGEEEVVEKAKKMILTKRLLIYDDIYKVGDIENVFRKADLQGGVDIGFIDYVQNVQVPEAVSDYQSGSILAKRLQKLAKDVSCTLVCLSQVSNDVGRGNTNQLEFKGAGEWAAVSDIGIHLQRSSKDKYALKYLIKKNRHGALHRELFDYKADFTSLEPMGSTN